VRSDVHAGDSPCNKIHSAIEPVRDGEHLRLLVPFEPGPLYGIVRNNGLGHQSRELGGGDWGVLFGRNIKMDGLLNSQSAGGSGCSGNHG